MLDVLVALLPATVMGCVYFGSAAIVNIVVSIAAAVISELAFRLIKRENIKNILRDFDFTSVVTGLLLSLSLPLRLLGTYLCCRRYSLSWRSRCCSAVRAKIS